MKISFKIIVFMIAAAAIVYGFTTKSDVRTTPASEGFIELAYSDGSPSTYGVRAINEVLSAVGVRVSTLPRPESAAHLFKASQRRALTSDEAKELISAFSLDRQGLLAEIQLAGRAPAAYNGGSLSTSEIGVPPYPKVYDMKSLSPEMTVYLQEKFGKLHVNSSEDGVGIDEVMTIVSGGPYTWFFVLPGNVVGKLTFGHVGKSGHAWRVSYPGLVPHGGFFDAEYGLVVAYAHGPDHFVMRYKNPGIQGAETLGKNPWIDFSKKSPHLLTNSHGLTWSIDTQTQPTTKIERIQLLAGDFYIKR